MSKVVTIETGKPTGRDGQLPHGPLQGPPAKRWLLHYWMACAFLKRDARLEMSYKFQFIWSFATVFFTVATFYFVAKLVSAGSSTTLAHYKNDYFSFVVIGVATSRYLEASLTGITTAIRQAMTQGTLEIMFVSPAHPMVILSLSAVWQILFETIRAAFCLAIAAMLFGMRLHDPNWMAAVLTLVLTIPAFVGLGVMSASLLILLKRGDPLNWFAVGAASLLGGAMFPIDLLPRVLQTVAYFVPLTHSLNGFRAALLQGASIGQVWRMLVPLLVFSLVMLPIAWLASGMALRYAKRWGSLGTY